MVCGVNRIDYKMQVTHQTQQLLKAEGITQRSKIFPITNLLSEQLLDGIKVIHISRSNQLKKDNQKYILAMPSKRTRLGNF